MVSSGVIEAYQDRGPRCRVCKFFLPDGSLTGQCRRYAPRPGATDALVEWPEVDDEDWCGEFALRHDAWWEEESDAKS